MGHRQSRWLFVIALFGGLAAFAALWYQSNQGATGSEPAFGGTYVEGVAGAPSRVNPLFAGQNAVDETLVALVFAGLTRLDDSGRPAPDLAESWTVSPDGLTYLFTLRPGLTWQDGAPLTADDVAFTYGLLRSPALRPSPSFAAVLSEAKVSRVDGQTVRIELAQPFAPLPAYLTLGILPVHILGNTGSSALLEDAFNQKPVGAGPYRLEELTPERAVLAANPAHHLGQPFVQRLEIRFFRDEGLLLTALNAKQVEGALFRGGIGPTELQHLEQRRDLKLYALPTRETTYVYFNLRLPIFQDRRLRQALLYAIDRDAIVTGVFAGQALRADSPVGAGSWAYSDSLRRYGADVNLAASLLNEAGWRLTDRGVRARGGLDLAFRLAVNNDPVRVAVANELAARWGVLGVRVTVETLGATGIVRDLIEPRSFEALLFAQTVRGDPDTYLVWHSSQTGPKGANLSSLRDDRIDRVLEEARLLATPQRRAELYAEFQELFAQEVPAIPLYVSTALYVQKSSLQGVRLAHYDSAGSRFWQVHEWYLKTR